MTDQSSNVPLHDYDAFISYRRRDGGRLANWIRIQLQKYRLPVQLGEERKKTLKIYLDTAFERATEDFWKNSIEPALQRSRFLIVVCTESLNQPRMDGTKN